MKRPDIDVIESTAKLTQESLEKVAEGTPFAGFEGPWGDIQALIDWVRHLEIKTEAETSPIGPLLDALRRDRSYLLTWHANIAMAAYDTFADVDETHERRWSLSQDAARRLLTAMFAGEPGAPEMITNDEVRGGLRGG